VNETTWTDPQLIDPHKVADKQRRVRDMFTAIAPSYDLNNRLHSFGRDQAWRRRVARLANPGPDEIVVDVACGTGDLTLALHDERTARHPRATGRTIGIDYTFAMLPRSGRKTRPGVDYLQGDAQSLPLPNASADVMTIAFGIRNVQSPAAAVAEFRRVLRPGGRVIILEFSQPENRIIRWCNDLYCRRIMPITATLISGDRSGAYKYLPSSVATFLSREQTIDLLQTGGFVDVAAHPMTFGVCVAYVGRVGWDDPPLAAAGMRADAAF
jgi:demethylmenaquinone methyltransferase / 2-methoxy-6-polyprenyl-1,4-benzoquinol methylase